MNPCQGNRCGCEMDPYGDCSCEINSLCPERPDLVPGGCSNSKQACQAECQSLGPDNCQPPGGGGGGGRQWPHITKQVTDCASDYAKQWDGTKPYNCKSLLYNCCMNHGGNHYDCDQGSTDWCVMKHHGGNPPGPVTPGKKRHTDPKPSAGPKNNFLAKPEGKAVASVAAVGGPMAIAAVLLLLL